MEVTKPIVLAYGHDRTFTNSRRPDFHVRGFMLIFVKAVYTRFQSWRTLRSSVRSSHIFGSIIIYLCERSDTPTNYNECWHHQYQCVVALAAYSEHSVNASVLEDASISFIYLRNHSSERY